MEKPHNIRYIKCCENYPTHIIPLSTSPKCNNFPKHKRNFFPSLFYVKWKYYACTSVLAFKTRGSETTWCPLLGSEVGSWECKISAPGSLVPESWVLMETNHLYNTNQWLKETETPISGRFNDYISLIWKELCRYFIKVAVNCLPGKMSR